MLVKYYTSDDLIMRRVNTARWICEQTHKLKASFNYGELVDQNYLTEFQYVVAALEALECYTPITSEAQDGEDNCLTEAQVEAIINNIEHITGLSFHCKQTTYNPNNYEGVTSDYIPSDITGNGTDIETNEGDPISLNPQYPQIAFGPLTPESIVRPRLWFSEIVLPVSKTVDYNQKAEYKTISFGMQDLRIVTHPDMPYTDELDFWSDIMFKAEIKNSTLHTEERYFFNKRKDIGWTSFQAFAQRFPVIVKDANTNPRIDLGLYKYDNRGSFIPGGFTIWSEAGDAQWSSTNANAERTGVYWYAELTFVAVKYKMQMKLFVGVGDLPNSITDTNVLTEQEIIDGKAEGQGSRTIGDTIILDVNPPNTQIGDGVFYRIEAHPILISDLEALQSDQITNGL